MTKAVLFTIVLAVALPLHAGGRKPKPTGLVLNATILHDLDTGSERIIAKPVAPWRFREAYLNPDGSKLLIKVTWWDTYGKPLAEDIRTMDMEGKNERIWLRTNQLGRFAWSPDGRLIYVEILDSLGSNRDVIIDTESLEGWFVHVAQDLPSPVDPIWSRDGKGFFYARPDATSPEVNRGFTIVRADLNGANVQDIVTLPAGGGASLSPDEKTVAYIPRHNQDLHLVDVATGKVRLTKRTSAWEIGQFWSPDGKWVGVRQDTRATMDPNKFYAVNVETGEWRFLFQEHGGFLSWWQPPVGLLPDCGKIVREMLGPGKPLEAVLKDIQSRSPEPLRAE
ncbi:MAG: hypothetical protein ACT4O3_05660 [Elusimicrobiota bacterium]